MTGNSIRLFFSLQYCSLTLSLSLTAMLSFCLSLSLCLSHAFSLSQPRSASSLFSLYFLDLSRESERVAPGVVCHPGILKKKKAALIFLHERKNEITDFMSRGGDSFFSSLHSCLSLKGGFNHVTLNSLVLLYDRENLSDQIDAAEPFKSSSQCYKLSNVNIL